MKLTLPLFLLLTASPALAATFALNSFTTVVAPSTRGGANTTFYGWDTFTNNPGDPGFPNLTLPINDSTPDLGTNPGFALLVTNNGQDHISSSGNYYSASGSVDETVTFDTDGSAASGFTTLILQGVTAFGPFGVPVSFSDINGVSPVVVQGLNAAGNGQFWARWDLPGNQNTYTGTLFSTANSNVSLDRLTVDTWWNSGSFQPDTMAIPEPASTLTFAFGALFVFHRRRR